jgi:hypothetical protein
MADDVAGSSPAPAPAPVESADSRPATTAVEQAVADNKFSTFRDASRAERSGTPKTPAPPADATPAAAAAPTEAQRQISKQQQRTNDYERRIAEQAAEIARLKTPAQAAAPRRDAAPAPAPTPEKFPTYDGYLATNPDASLEDWMDARDTWRDDKQSAAAQMRAEADQRVQSEQTRATTFSTQVGERTKTDPAFLQKISPDVLALRPFAALGEGEVGGPLNAIAEELLDSPVAPALMEHFTAHPEDLQRLTTLRDPRALIREFGKLEARFDAAAAADDAPAPHKTITAAPTPGTTLGSRPAVAGDPIHSAVASGNFSAFRAASLAARKAHR